MLYTISKIEKKKFLIIIVIPMMSWETRWVPAEEEVQRRKKEARYRYNGADRKVLER